MEEIKALNDNALEQAAGGSGARENPHYNEIKRLYMEKGYRTAVLAASYMGIDDAEISEMIKLIIEEVG